MVLLTLTDIIQKLKKHSVYLGGGVSYTPLINQAEEVSFSIGGGYPFFVPEVSLVSNEGEHR